VASYYKVFESNGKVFADASKGAGCYGMYTHNRYKGDRRIEVYIRKGDAQGYNGTPFTREQVKEYIVNLINAGFPCWLREQRTKYVVTIDETHYYNFSQVRTMLDYLRTLWEGVVIARHYFELPESYRNQHDFFMLIQAISCLHRITNGYPVPSGTYLAIIPSHELIDFCRKNRNHVKGCSQLWYELREGGTSAARDWKNSKYAPFIREVDAAIKGSFPKQPFNTLNGTQPQRVEAPAPPAAVRKTVRRNSPVAASVE